MLVPGTITRSEQYGIASSSAAPTSQQSLQCNPGSVVIGIVVYQADYDVQYEGYNSSSTYIGEYNCDRWMVHPQ